MKASLSASEARRVALAAQGLHRARPARRPGAAAVLALVDRLGVLQMDAVNVLARAHYVPVFSRLGPYDVAHVDAAAYAGDRRLFEYWGHQASLLPVRMQPLFRWRMEAYETLQGTWAFIADVVREKRSLVDAVLEEVTARGPLAAGDLERPQKRSGPWWGWSEAKIALEYLFRCGRVTTAGRRGFERIYDLPERVLPPAVLGAPTPSVEDATRELLRVSARALGVATDDDLADYFRLRLRDARPRIAELIEEGELLPVAVEGIAQRALVARDAVCPRAATGRAILSPFDPLVWHRPRAERMFDFHYRIGIYTPAHLREHGYYVLPFLLGERIAARVDLKADRKESALLVQASHIEPGAKAADVAGPLAAELADVAAWLGLARVVVRRKGSLAAALGRAGRRSNG